MANLSVINILPNRIANIYVKLRNITSQLHNTLVSIGFIGKALFFDRVPNLQMLQHNSSIKRSFTDSRKLMKSNLMKYVQDLYN